MNEIFLAITDDDELIVKLLEEYFSSQKDFKILFTANDGQNLIEKLKEAVFLPDVLILDLKMDGMNGIETTKYLNEHYPEIKIVVVSSHYQQNFSGFMLKSGAAAFVPKGILPKILVDIIKSVHDKGIYLLDEQVGILRDQIKEKLPSPNLTVDTLLTSREIEVLKLIAAEKTAKEISEILFINHRTVEGHKNNLFLKTETKNIAGLVIYGIKNKIIDLNELHNF